MEGKVLLRCCLATLMISVVTKAIAVDDNHLDFSPKTPEAAAFQQVGDIPVGNYTGTMNLSIPLYTIECGNLKVPISLDYLGSAIRVDQEATWVGLNWMLNAGGAITTRLSNSLDQLNGISGSYKCAWRHVLNHLSMTRAYSNGGSYDYRIFYKFDGFHPIRGGYGREWFNKTEEPIDTTNLPNDIPYQLYGQILTYGNGESPTYNANFLGHHLSFIWDRLEDEFFITGNAEGFKISGSCTSPVITDGNGIVYEFFTMEQGYPEGSNVNPSLVHYDRTFYLTKIISPTGKTIRFAYRNYGVTRPVYKVSEEIFSNDYPANPLIDEVNISMTSRLDNVGTSGSRVLRKLSPYYNFQPMRLDNITVDEDGDEEYEMKIKFNLNTTARQDIRGIDYSLNNIEIYKKLANGTDQLLKRFRFQYSYFPHNTIGGNVVKDLLGTTTYNSWFNNNDDFMYYRLKLDSLWEETVEESTVKKKPAYLFNYSNITLPCKASAAIDYWGYYNGKENNTGMGSYYGFYHTLIPKGWDMITYDNALNYPDPYLSTHGADRRPNAAYAQAGMLTSMTYPTGATAHFEYEANTFRNYDYFDAARTSKSLQFTPFTVYSCNTPNYNPSGTNLYNGEHIFTVSTAAEFDLQVAYVKSDQQSASYWQILSSNPVLIQKYVNYGNQIESTSPYPLLTVDTLASTGVLNKTFRITLSPGKYRLLTPNLSNSTYPAAFYEISAHFMVHPDFETKGAGIRIKSIRHVSDGITTTTSYTYTQENSTKSSGQLMAPAIFARQKLLIYQNGQFQIINGVSVYPPAPSEIRYWMASGDNLAPPAAYGVCYSRVAVSKSSGSDNNGKTVFEYNNQRWSNGSMWDFMRRIENPLNGMLTDQYDYNSDGQLVHKVHNTYQMNCVSSRLRNAVVENVYYGPSNVTGGNAVNSFNAYADVLNGGCMMIYLYPSVQFSIDNITTTSSDYVDNNALSITREVTYNQMNHQEALIRESTSRSGEYIQTEILYPTDYTNYSVATNLSNNHIINVPMEVVKSVDYGGTQYVADAERTEYTTSGLPTYIFSLNATGLTRSNFALSNVDSSIYTNYEIIKSFTYNSLGKPRTIVEYGNPTTYVWGYRSTLPVAVIRGAYSTLVQWSFGSMANWDNFEKAATPSMTSSALYNSLSEIPGALVTIYEHNPYVGVVRIIAPNGETTTYDYDSFARLIKITDHNGIISNQFQYNYRRNE